MAEQTGGGLRDMMRILAHRPFQEEIAQRFLWLFGLGPDGVLEKSNQGLRNRRILQATTGGLARLGEERGIVHGLTESDASYAARVQRAIDDWQRAGSAWSIMSQLLGYVTPSKPPADIVSTLYSSAGVAQSSQWDSFEVNADPTRAPVHTLDATGNFDWDSASPTTGSWQWWRIYVVLDAVTPHNWINAEGLWGSGGLWGDGGAWGVDAANNLTGLSIRLIVNQWRPKAVAAHWIIISFNDTLFDATQPAGGGVNPDGNFGRWSKLSGGVYVRSRFSDARYFTGSPVP